jgi:hypothetical protein
MLSSANRTVSAIHCCRVPARLAPEIHSRTLRREDTGTASKCRRAAGFCVQTFDELRRQPQLVRPVEGFPDTVASCLVDRRLARRCHQARPSQRLHVRLVDPRPSAPGLPAAHVVLALAVRHLAALAVHPPVAQSCPVRTSSSAGPSRRGARRHPPWRGALPATGIRRRGLWRRTHSPMRSRGSRRDPSRRNRHQPEAIEPHRQRAHQLRPLAWLDATAARSGSAIAAGSMKTRVP